MFYEKIKVAELQEMTVNDITPNYTVESYDFEIDKITNKQIHYAYGVNIIKTAEEVYSEWEIQQNTIPQMKFEELLLLKQSEQEEVLQTILLDVAILKGETTNV